MTTAFHKATGIPVKLDDNSTGPLLTQIEASKNNPNWGLLWVDGATAFAGLDQQGLTGVFAQTRAARGESVGLMLEPGGCHVFTDWAQQPVIDQAGQALGSCP
jgi:iron(III) transport system substrate-binding protein